MRKRRNIVLRKATRKKPIIKKTVGTALDANGSRPAREDILDARLIREARRSDHGRARHSVNELRARRGLAAV